MESNSEANALLKQVREGMKVYDAGGEEVGNVDFVHFGEPEAVTTESDRGAGEGGGDAGLDLLDVFDPDADNANERKQRFGYIKIDGKGLFSGEKFASSEQIASVSGDEVTLNITKDAM